MKTTANLTFNRILAILMVLTLLISCAGCAGNTNGSYSDTDTGSQTQTGVTGDKTDDKTGTGSDNAGSSGSAADSDAAGDAKLQFTTDTPAGISQDGSVYRITKGGEYIFSGTATEARIVVDADDEEVTIVLNGADISSSIDSVIFVEDADEVTIKAQNGTVNRLSDLRPEKSSDDDETGSACIYSKDDLKLQGKGTLIVTGNYNNGIHSKNDIKIKNLTLEVTALNNAIKGNDSITVESGTLTIISSDGDGLKTKNSDVSSKGKQHGIIRIEGGTIDIYADSDCIQAAYDVVIADEAVVNQYEYK